MRLLIRYYILAALFFAHPAIATETSGGITSHSDDASRSPSIVSKPRTEPVFSPSPSLTETGTISSKDIFSEKDRADSTDPYVSEKKKKADEYFKRGVLLYEGDDFANAAEAFQVAYETLPHPAVLGNIAMCYDSAGKIPEAVTYYRRYFETPVFSDKNGFMKERLESLAALVADLRIRCDRSCAIRVDGIERGKTAIQAVVMPGTHRVEGVVDDEVLSSELISVKARQIKAMSLVFPPEEEPEETAFVPTPVPVVIPEPRQPKLGTGFWFSSGMTVISLSLVTAFGTMTLNEKEDYRASNWTNAGAKEKGERYKTITNAMVGLTGASAAAALLFALSDFNGRRKSKRNAIDVSPGPGVGVAVSY